MDAIVLRPGEGEALEIGPAHALIKATADTTGGLFTLSETTLPAGTCASLPPGVAHTFSNPCRAPVRFLNLNAPGGFEAYLRDLSAAISADEPPDAADMAALFARHDVHPA